MYFKTPMDEEILEKESSYEDVELASDDEHNING